MSLKHTPLVSVVMPCFNGARWLADAIDSALAQTWTHLEVLVVDDGSTDESVEIARSYGDPVRSLVFPNGGPSVARNRGLSVARGEFVQFLDADDLLMPRKVEACLEAVEGPLDIPFSRTRTFREGGERRRDALRDWVRGWFREPDAPVYHDHPAALVLTTESQIHQWLHRRDLLASVDGFRKNMHWLEDIDLNLRLALAGGRPRLVDEVLVACRDHSTPGRQRLDPRSVLAGLDGERLMLRTVEEAGALDDLMREIFAHRLAWTARRAWRAGYRSEAREAFELARSLHRWPKPTGFRAYNRIANVLGLERTEAIVDVVSRASGKPATASTP